jgi:hypothetical protein
LHSKLQISLRKLPFLLEHLICSHKNNFAENLSSQHPKTSVRTALHLGIKVAIFPKSWYNH